jgi:pullulanase/glycogen debranching enzyme
MFYMQRRLGAWQVGDDSDRGKAEFKVFFPAGFDPQIKSIQVAGDFQEMLGGGDNWDFAAGYHLVRQDIAEGSLWSFQTPQELPAGFYQYKYYVTYDGAEPRKLSDPCTRYGGENNQNAGFVIGGSQPSENLVAPLAGGRLPLRDLVIYEMHLDDFTDEYREARAPLDAAADDAKLDHLADLGVNAILFMPWTSWKNRDVDWGYEPFLFFAVEYRYANDLERPAEKISYLKKLISKCHQRGIHVIMDGVFNHVSREFPYHWFYKNPEKCPYTGDFGGTFTGLQDLDFNNACTQEFIRDVCLYWIDVFKIDGIRFDNTVNYHCAGDARGIPKLLEDIQAHLDAKGESNFSLTLEHLEIGAAQLVKDTKATSYWDNAMYERCFDYLWRGEIDSRILNSFNNNRHLGSLEKAATIYLGNHDHSHVAWQAGARQNMGALKWYKTQPYAIVLLTCPGAPMIQNGQEFGEDYWIPENDQNTGRRVLPRPLRWKLLRDPIGQALFKLYSRLSAIRHSYPALRSNNFYPEEWEEWQTRFNQAGFGVDTQKQVVIFHRWGHDQQGNLQRFIIVLNFSDSDQPVSVHFPENGEWTDLLSGLEGSWRPIVNDYKFDMVVGSNWGHVFFRQ